MFESDFGVLHLSVYDVKVLIYKSENDTIIALQGRPQVEWERQERLTAEESVFRAAFQSRASELILRWTLINSR